MPLKYGDEYKRQILANRAARPEILRLHAQGLSDTEIGHRLNMHQAHVRYQRLKTTGAPEDRKFVVR